MLDRLLGTDALWFTIAAGVGTIFFLLRMGLMILGGIGGDLELEADVDLDVDADGLDDVTDADDSTGAFRVLSIQSIAAFVMGFGWGGLSGLIGLDWTVGPSIGAGIALGVGMVWLLGLLMKAVYDLRSSGNIDRWDTVGCEGQVYLGIPQSGAGTGQVRIVVHERSRIYDAVSDDEAIPTGSRVRVVGLRDDGTLTVASHAA